ncbi:MAG: hypothetical protein NTY93_00660 [Candidatus Kaiserbacteria bacterium]|nr:hypothetical protein [Candidatus Kaiserbacteria bacterium]
MRFGLLTALIFTLILPSVVSAQTISSAEAFTASVNPQYPAPYGQAVLSILSSTIDLNNAVAAVSVAGKEIYKGSVRPIAIQLGGAGIVTNVKVTITSAGANYSQTLSIQPQDVALIAEPISSVPPLYPGKSLVPFEGDVRVVAMANLQGAKGEIIDPAVLSYSWTVDDTQIANASGIGKQAIIVASPLQYRSRQVSVAVMSQDGSLVGGASFSLAAEEPSVRIYKNDPLLGILYDHALSGTYIISDAEDTFYAAPFSLPTTNGAPLLQWFLSGSIAQTGSSITLRPTGKGQGSAPLSLVASAGGSTKATENLSLSFGAASGGFSLFGL